MASSSLELTLNCKLNDTNTNHYVTVKLFDRNYNKNNKAASSPKCFAVCNRMIKFKKRIKYVEGKGLHSEFLLKQVDLHSDVLRIEVFSRRMFRSDKRVGEARVSMSELTSNGDNYQDSVTYDVVNLSVLSGESEGVLRLSYELFNGGRGKGADLKISKTLCDMLEECYRINRDKYLR